jgi:peptidyl-prolyl cis-trans isomerase SurA
MQIFYGQDLIDGIVATVGDKAILMSEVNTLASQVAIQNKINIQQNPMAWKQIQREVLQNLIQQKILLLKAEEDTITVADEEVDQYLQQQLDYLVSQAGSKEKLEQIYGMNFNQIKRNLRREVKNNMTIERLRQKWISELKISRKEVEEFYKTFKDSLPQQEETVDISHILRVPTPSEEALRKAYDKAFGILKQLKEGADFAELAKKYSEDPASAARGGDLGWANRGTFVKEFEEVAFSLKKGEISGIVQSQFGYHIIQLLDRQGEKIHTRHILIQVHVTPEDEKHTIQFLDSLRKEILAGHISFEKAAEKYSDDPNVSKDRGHLGEYVLKELKIPQFKDVLDTLKIGEISRPFKTDFGYHIIRLNRRTKARKLELTKDWDKIYRIAKNYKAQREFPLWIEELKKEYPIEIKISI